MDAKITLSFNEDVILRAKKYAAENNISLSRLTEFLLKKVTTKGYQTLDELPVSDWVNMVAEGQAEYIRLPKSSRALKDEFYTSKKKR